jgi:hypothetical protein
MSNSHWYYIHKDISGVKDFWKPGVTLHPSNVVRGIQRKQSKKFVIDHLYFGRPSDIAHLESYIKFVYKEVSGKKLFEWGNQTELFKVDINDLLSTINDAILRSGLDIVKVPLSKPYYGTNTTNCDLRLPGESVPYYFEEKANELFGYKVRKNQVLPTRKIYNLFED